MKDVESINVLVRKKKKTFVVPKHFGFESQKRGKRTLVTPFAQANWNKVSPWWRSLVYQRGGDVVSLGLPKFHDFESSLANQDWMNENFSSLTFREKMDGRLLIRSVYDNKVWWRTRNAFHADEYLQTIKSLVAQDNLLWDPNFETQTSLCFELCLPQERIVLEHSEPSLWLIGINCHNRLQSLGEEAVKNTAEKIKVSMPDKVVPENDLEDFVENIKGWEQKEGVVGYDANFQPVTRIKSLDYKLRHALRYDYPPGMLKKLGAKRFEAICEEIMDENLKKIVQKRWQLVQSAHEPDVWGELRTKLDQETKNTWQNLENHYA